MENLNSTSIVIIVLIALVILFLLSSITVNIKGISTPFVKLTDIQIVKSLDSKYYPILNDRYIFITSNDTAITVETNPFLKGFDNTEDAVEYARKWLFIKNIQLKIS